MKGYKLTEPIGTKVPIIVSSPHSGTSFPNDLQELYNQSLIKSPDDTDWFVDQLYDFVSELGITMISSNYSRWVIDLNRDPNSQPLYDDGRIITELCPTKNFLGESIYINGYKPTQEDIELRLENYYWPYYRKIQQVIDELKEEFGYAVFWDAHSIREYVPTIREEKFPQLILGDNDGKASEKVFSEIAIDQLKRKGYEVEYNYPFKGGHLTRYFGQPERNQHALQLEMTKVNYMDDSEITYHKGRAGKMRETLFSVFESLIETGKSLE